MDFLLRIHCIRYLMSDPAHICKIYTLGLVFIHQLACLCCLLCCAVKQFVLLGIFVQLLCALLAQNKFHLN